jgi:hypothetical protein
MTRRSIAVALAVALVAFVTPVASIAAPPDRTTAGFDFPINAASDAAGTFTGNLHINSFAVRDGALVASGIVTGTRVDENGVVTAIVRTVSLPVNTGSASTRAAAAPAASCGILHLELGPLDLDLLGLVVHLDRVVLDLSAVPGAGNLLGNLLCSLTNLLNGGGALTQIADLLNQILGLLT